MAKREEDKARHEYMLQEVRLTGEDIKAHICERFEPRIQAIEKVQESHAPRLTSLEHFRTYAHAVVATLAMFGGFILHGMRGKN